MMIANRLGRLPTRQEAQQQFAERQLTIVDFQERPTGVFSYPCVWALTQEDGLYYCDMYHGGGTMWCPW